MPDRYDCSNKDRGDPPEPALAPSLSLMRLPWEKVPLGGRGGATGAAEQLEASHPRLFIRRQRKNFAPGTEVKLKVSREGQENL